MTNQRKHSRLPLPMKVEVSVAGQAPAIMTTRDMSDGGVFLEKNENIVLQMATKVTIKVLENMQGEEPPAIPATVVRITDDGFAVQFDLN